MKLSDAMREADARELPNLRFRFIQVAKDRWGGEKPPCCAIGGANVVRGIPFKFNGKLLAQDSAFAAQAIDWAELAPCDAEWTCPVSPVACLGSKDTLNTITHLYDHHLWSRTQIADWLDEVLA